MSARVKEQRPIHMRDPLFREVFAHADKIVMRHENTPKGVKVVETSGDPYVAKLIQAHAEVVSLFHQGRPRRDAEEPRRADRDWTDVVLGSSFLFLSVRVLVQSYPRTKNQERTKNQAPARTKNKNPERNPNVVR